jgi:hypothetical protein
MTLRNELSSLQPQLLYSLPLPLLRLGQRQLGVVTVIELDRQVTAMTVAVVAVAL